MEVSIKADESLKGKEILRLRDTIREANRIAPLRMTRVWVTVFWLLLFSRGASATTYYVSSSTGSDANSATSPSTPWQTISHVNAQTFQPGDSILFKRGDVWNEQLAPASSGTSGNSITFDAYGTGSAPNLTGYYAVPPSAWVLVSGNAWKAPLPASYTTINFCLFGSIWGQKVAAATVNLTDQWDFYLANGYVYVFATSNPATYYNEPIVPMALSNVPVININGKSWLTFQHFLVNWFDQYGVYVQGTSDHLVFANMEADSMIPQGTQPLGFYVNESAPGPSDIKIYNSEAHMNYDGFRFDGTASAITMINDKAYANRDGALVDNTSAVSYSYCHFYASSLAVAGSTDVLWTSGSGPTAGAGNIAADTPPAVQQYQRYPAEVTLTVDDAGMTPNADVYYANTVLPIADAAGVPVGAAITVGYPLAQSLVTEFQGWVNAGRDVTSHSMSHTYYTNTDALDIQYTGSGTAAVLSISGKTLTITVTGASDSVSYNLTQGQAQGTILGLQQALAATGKFTTSYLTPCQGPYGTGCSAYTAQALLAQDLADVSGQDVKTSVYHLLLDVTRLTTDEITLSRQWMTTNLTGLPTTPVYVYPGGYETTAMQEIAEGVPYTGARGALKEDLGVKDTYADGFNLQNVTSFGVNPSWMGLQPAVLNQKIQALVWKEAIWGVPWGIFWHWNASTESGELSATEVTNLIGDLKASGATIRTNTGLVNWLQGGTQVTGTDGNYYYALPANSMALDFGPTKNSPVVNAGQNLGTAYALDIDGVNQNSYGSAWEIGAHVYQGYAVYGEGGGAGTSKIGGAQNLPFLATLPQVWVNGYEGDSLFSYELSLPSTWVTGPAPSCTFHAPYWTGSPTNAGLQSAINDIEACRTATGAGIKLDVPPALYTSAAGLVIPQSSNSPASSFLILDSTQDSSLPNGQTVCSHGIQDNLATSTDIGLNNPDCTGQNMYYQLGPANSSSVISGITTLSINTTTLTAITSTGSQSVRLANGYVGPGINVVVDTGANQETVTTTSCAQQTGMCGNFTLTHASGVPVTLCTSGCSYTLANGNVINTANYNDLSSMYTIECSGASNCVPLTFCSPLGTSPDKCSGTIGPDHWLIEDAEVRMSVGNTGNNYIVSMLATQSETSYAQLSSHIHFRKDWVHGDWTSLGTGANAISAALALDGSYISMLDSQTSQNLRPGSEGHTITPNGPGPYKFNHNWLEGQSSGIFSGGFGFGLPPLHNIAGFVPFQDVEIRRNHETFPYPWLGLTVANNLHGWSGNSIERKNITEIKEGERILEDGNIFEDVDQSGGQNGTTFTIDVVGGSNAGTVTSSNYQTTINDVTMSNNITRQSCESWEILGTSTGGLGNNVGLPFNRGFFSNNLFYGQGVFVPGCSTVNSTAITLSTAYLLWQGTVTGNGTTATFTANCATQDTSSGAPIAAPTCMGQVASGTVTSGGTGCVAGNLTISAPSLPQGIRATGTYACSGGALSSITIKQPGYGYTSAPTATIATGTGTLTLSLVTSPVAPGTGYAQLDLLPGTPFWIMNCQSIPGFNVPTTTGGGQTYPAGIGPLAAAGTVPNSLSVSWPSTVSGTDSSGYCTIAVGMGAPNSLILSHNSSITNSTHGIAGDNAQGPPGGPNYQQNNAFVNNLFLSNGGCIFNNPLGEGTPTQIAQYDTSSWTFAYNVCPTRTASTYHEYGNNPQYPDSAGCTGAGCHPPSTIYFPSTAYCTGATPTSSCVGFTGVMSASSMNVNLADYHGYELIAGSSFKAGGAEDASDGTDMGANIAAIDTAQTQNVYVCQTNCGATGPYPDLPNPPIAPSFFGEHVNVTTDPFPTISFGAYRNLTGQTDWADIETASGTYGFTKLNGWLSKAATAGVDAMYTFFRTPTFYSSNPTGTCTGASTGTCYPPTDIAASCTNVNGLNNCDGKTDGTDQHFKNFVTALVADVGKGISFYEGWNEYNQTWAGTTAQLVRMMQDARAIVLATNPSAKFLNPSVVFTYNPRTWATDLTPWTTLMSTSGIDAVSDIINIHGYTLNTSSSLSVAELEVPLVTGVRATLDAADAAKPFWISEFGWGASMTNGFTDPDMRAAYVSRAEIIAASLGVQRTYWFGWDEGNGAGTLWWANNTDAEGCNGSGVANAGGYLCEAGAAMQVVYNWLLNARPQGNCNGPAYPLLGVWSCLFTQASTGEVVEVVWDSYQTCSGGSCTTSTYTPSAGYTRYSDLAGQTGIISGGTVQIGAKPILLN